MDRGGTCRGQLVFRRPVLAVGDDTHAVWLVAVLFSDGGRRRFKDDGVDLRIYGN